MILENYRFITAINGVAAGNVATVQLPAGARIKDLFLVYKTNANQATIESDITRVVLNINGQPRRTMTPNQIFVKEAHSGRAFQAGMIPIRFRDPGASDDRTEDLTALNTFRLASATIEVTIAGGATSPTLEAYACFDGIDDKNDFLTVWDSVTFTNSGAGTKTKTDLVRSGIYQRLDFFGTTNLPSRVKVRADDKEIIDSTAATVARLAADYGYSAQSNHLPILFTHTRRTFEGLDMVYPGTNRTVERFEVEYTTGASGDITAIAERIVKLV